MSRVTRALKTSMALRRPRPAALGASIATACVIMSGASVTLHHRRYYPPCRRPLRRRQTPPHRRAPSAGAASVGEPPESAPTRAPAASPWPGQPLAAATGPPAPQCPRYAAVKAHTVSMLSPRVRDWPALARATHRHVFSPPSQLFVCCASVWACVAPRQRLPRAQAQQLAGVHSPSGTHLNTGMGVLGACTHLARRVASGWQTARGNPHNKLATHLCCHRCTAPVNWTPAPRLDICALRQ